MAGLMEMFQNPNVYQWISGLGGGLSRAGRGQGFDISGANQQLYQGLAGNQRQQDLTDAMGQFDLTPQQQGLLSKLSPKMQQQIAADLMFPQQGGDPAVWEQKYNANVAGGMNPVTARNIQTGIWGRSRDPVTGQVTVIDMSTGQPVDYGQGADAPAPQAQVPVADPLYGQVEAATGYIPAVKAALTDTLGQVSGLFSFPDTVQAQQNYKVATNDLIRSLSVNPKFPVGEMDRIRDEIAITPAAFNSPDGMRGRMKAVHNYLTNRVELEKAAANDPRLPADQRQAAIQASRNIENFLNILGVPDFDAALGLSSDEETEIGNAPPGSVISIPGQGDFVWDGANLIPQ